tara:strand:+ start:155 stop:844 length:690 start_codon:yes stop_codon:yes gene_type:complete
MNYQNTKRVRNEEHAILYGGHDTKPARPSVGRRGKHTPMQKYEQLCKLLEQGKVQRWTSYLNKHHEVLMPILTAKQVKPYPNTPVEKVEAADPHAKYECAMRAWRERCSHLYRIRKEANRLAQQHASHSRSKWAAYARFAKKHMLDLIAEDPIQPVEPDDARTTAAPLDGRTGIRKEVAAKTKALTSIDKRMAEEQRKARAAKQEEPRPVMRHHTESNPWLHAKHARNK